MNTYRIRIYYDYCPTPGIDTLYESENSVTAITEYMMYVLTKYETELTISKILIDHEND